MNTTPITIGGNLADIPELRFTPSGKATARMRVAVNARHRNQAGEWVETGTSWHTVIAWGSLAEHLAGSAAGKGDRVLVHGRLAQRDYTTEAGDKRTVWEITADDIGLSLRHRPARTAGPEDAGSPAE